MPQLPLPLPATLLSALLLLASPAAPLPAQDTGDDAAKSQDKDAAKPDDPLLDLEALFPEHGLFGPGAGDTSFSHDGQWAAFTWRTREERRHGGDLWVVGPDGAVRRVTSPVVMAEYLRDAREVLRDRKKRWEKEHEDEEQKDEEQKDKKQKQQNGDADAEPDGTPDGAPDGAPDDDDAIDHLRYLLEDDVDAEKAPRWRGVGSIAWSPRRNELIFACSGDLFRYEPAEERLTRLTRTDDGESRVQWLPDGSGYAYERDDKVQIVRLGEPMTVELDPMLERDESLLAFRIDPTGRRVAMTVRKGPRVTTPVRNVKIARYRNRFVDVREVPRHVSDDPQKDSKTIVYLHELAGTASESARLLRVHTHEVSGPRDVLSTPRWAADGSKVTFATFTQDSSKLAIFEARWQDADDAEDADDAAGTAAEQETGSGAQPAPETTVSMTDITAEERAEPRDAPARKVYEWLHFGGPNTPRMIEPEYLADGRSILFLSEQSGFRHLHVLDPRWQSTRALTTGHYEVYPLELTRERDAVYALATRDHPARTGIFRIDPQTGQMQKLSSAAGTYSGLAVAPDGRRALATFVRYGALRELALLDLRTGKQQLLTDSHDAVAREATRLVPEFFDFENRHGHVVQGMTFLPPGWKQDEQRPCLVYVYGGPLGTRKNVVDGSYQADAYLFHAYMAHKHGFVTATIDPRGMSGYGALFEKSNYEQVGKPQVEDLVDGVKHLVAEYGVDPDRVGLHGWSFGGFQTQMCLYTKPEFFACGAAGAGPTEWENYNSWYSTGTIGPSREGKPDLKAFSLLPLAKKLERPLLLVHGMEDSNVLYQDTVRVYRELLKAGKETLVELFVDPTGGHGLGGDVERVNRARKYEQFFLRHLTD